MKALCYHAQVGRGVTRHKVGDRAIRLQPLHSSVLKAVGYDAQQRVLRVRFPNGRIYEYLDVAPKRWAALMAAESRGAFFNRHIRDDHRFRRLD